jgi:hypothetical protein
MDMNLSDKISTNQMGNNLDAYRAAIGLFHACKMSLNIGYDSINNIKCKTKRMKATLTFRFRL